MMMKTLLSIIGISVMMAACAGGKRTGQTAEQSAPKDEVVVMNKQLFLSDVFDYEKSDNWEYKGNKPAIIDFYADWCGPCRAMAPIMRELAGEYSGKVTIYKVNVDKERELAAMFNATSIPLFVFIPMQGEPQVIRGAADKATYKEVIDSFLLGIQ
jgi:thioredoxin